MFELVVFITFFYKGYLPKWSEEVFKVIGRKRLSGKNLYKVADLLEEEITGHFYEVNLQRVEKPEFFRIEKILKTKKTGSNTQYLVQWLGYPPKFNSWVSETDLDDGNQRST